MHDLVEPFSDELSWSGDPGSEGAPAADDVPPRHGSVSEDVGHEESSGGGERAGEDRCDVPPYAEITAEATPAVATPPRRWRFSPGVAAWGASVLLHVGVAAASYFAIRSFVESSPAAFEWGDGSAETGLVDRGGAAGVDAGPAGGGLAGPEDSNAGAAGGAVMGRPSEPTDAESAAALPEPPRVEVPVDNDQAADAPPPVTRSVLSDPMPIFSHRPPEPPRQVDPDVAPPKPAQEVAISPAVAPARPAPPLPVTPPAGGASGGAAGIAAGPAGGAVASAAGANGAAATGTGTAERGVARAGPAPGPAAAGAARPRATAAPPSPAGGAYRRASNGDTCPPRDIPPPRCDATRPAPWCSRSMSSPTAGGAR